MAMNITEDALNDRQSTGFGLHRIKRPLLAMALCLVTTGCHSGMRWTGHGPKPGQPIRAIWVTRWDYKTPHDISVALENARRAGFNTVLFQVRGNGTVCYRSRLEPWAEEFKGRDPGFDPLAVACKEAHRRKLALHAWVNVMPGWRGKEPPKDPRQLYHSRPDWFWRDGSGRRQPLGWYNSLNPCWPEVRQYLTSVMHEIVTRYPVDGLHMDYIRFPNEWVDAYSPRTTVPDYPRDPKTLALFRKATGHTPESSPGHWNAWRSAQVTQLVREIRNMMLHVRPRVQLSAAVGAEPDEALRKHFQDPKRWIADGLLDAAYPMNYSNDRELFARRVDHWDALSRRTHVVMGLQCEKRDPALVIDQIRKTWSREPHVAIFAYNLLFERLDAGGRPIMDGDSAHRAAMRKSVIPLLRNAAGGRS
jgi:uncharacterized lipoprotein YddW (UPF0748 family)